jgi:hypothetical protein
VSSSQPLLDAAGRRRSAATIPGAVSAVLMPARSQKAIFQPLPHAPGRTRTCDHRIRSPALCPAELRGPWEETVELFGSGTTRRAGAVAAITGCVAAAITGWVVAAITAAGPRMVACGSTYAWFRAPRARSIRPGDRTCAPRFALRTGAAVTSTFALDTGSGSMGTGPATWNGQRCAEGNAAGRLSRSTVGGAALAERL